MIYFTFFLLHKPSNSVAGVTFHAHGNPRSHFKCYHVQIAEYRQAETHQSLFWTHDAAQRGWYSTIVFYKLLLNYIFKELTLTLYKHLYWFQLQNYINISAPVNI